MINILSRASKITALPSILAVSKRTMTSTEVLHFVFVYGTLKKDEPNHAWLEKPGVRFIGDGITKKTYPLVIATKYNIPFLLDSPGRGKNVRGEIYEVNDTVLGELDQLEEHPHFYVRRLESICSVNGQQEQPCWTYFLPKFKPDLLNLPTLESYNSSGDHGLKYRESDDDFATADDVS